jgi:hypothetical protein
MKPLLSAWTLPPLTENYFLSDTMKAHPKGRNFSNYIIIISVRSNSTEERLIPPEKKTRAPKGFCLDLVPLLLHVPIKERSEYCPLAISTYLGNLPESMPMWYK